MRFARVMVYLSVVLAGQGSDAQTVSPVPAGFEQCRDLKQRVMAHMARGETREIEKLLSAANSASLEWACQGPVLNNMAGVAAVSGRLAEAEILAERAIDELEHKLPPDDPAMLCRPQILAAVQYEQGKTAKARATFSKMESIRTERAGDRALVQSLRASLLEAERRWNEAESAYVAALAAWREAGRADTADAGAVLGGLGSLYIKQRRWRDAAETLDRALAVFTAATDAVPMDTIKLLNIRGVLHARRREWRQAGEDLERAVLLADSEPQADPVILRTLFVNYAHVLRKTQRGREAGLMEARADRLQGSWRAGAVVDASELLAGRRVSGT